MGFLDLMLMAFVLDKPTALHTDSKFKTLRFPDAETDAIWLEALTKGEIVESTFFKPEGSAISEKHVIIIAHKGVLYKTMAKLFQPSSSVDFTPNVLDAKVSGDDNIFRRADRDFQAFPEIVGYHVDRVLGIYRKPLFVSRVVTNKILYQNIAWFPSWNIGRVFRSIQYKLLYFSHEYNIYISLQPWMDDLSNSPPSLKIKDYLLLSEREKPQDQRLLQELIEVSDTLVYDFLVDEHDRKAEKNWVVSANKTQLLWDNGLAFDHGPYGRESCLDILCATNEWRSSTPKEKPCERICRFSKSMYNKLVQFSKETGNNRLGRKIQASVNDDLLTPLFQFAQYEHFKDDVNRVSFKVDNFWEGMEIKLERILGHMNYCIDRYGERTVLL